MNKTIVSKLPDWHLKNKRVFFRADLNVPIDTAGNIFNDFRLHAILSTIDMLITKGCKIILATHMGRPKKEERHLSTHTLVSWFEQQGYKITHEPDLQKAKQKSHLINDTILLLENMRFFPGEKKDDKEFAQQLKQLADYYVNDAFALLHRTDTSITLLPQLFDADTRTIGPLVEQELTTLGNIRFNPAHPYMLIIGGGKVHDKLPYLFDFLDKVDVIALCPAIVFTLAKAMGTRVGRSLVDDSALEQMQKFLRVAQEKNVRILFPVDYLIAQENLEGPLSYCDADNIPENAVGIAIGPKTIEAWKQEIKKTETIFFNAAMGMLERPETLEPLKQLLYVVAESSAYTIVGGGQSVATVKKYHLEHGINYLSTGGGAALAYVGGQELPGIDGLY